MEDDRPLSAKEKRQEQIKRWENSATDLECASYANPKVRVKFDDGAVFLAACSAGDLDEVKVLLEGGADINFANVDGLTALHQACIDGNLEIVQFLVEHGSEIDQEDNEGWTPLHATASCGFMEIAKYLVKKGANVGAVNSEAELPIDTAEDDEMVEYLQSEIDNQGIDVEAARDIERSVMLQDANDFLNRYQNGERLEIYKHPKSGATALHITAAKGYNDVMKILIKAGFDVNAHDNDGWTPLHAAAHWSQEESAKILADKGADFKTRSKLGQKPFDVADEDMLEYLQELETEQKENVKPEPLIEPPPLKKEKRSSPTKDEVLKINEINGEKPSKKIIDKSPETSSEEDTQPPASRITAPPPRSPLNDVKSSPRERDKTTSLTNDHSATEDILDRYTRRNRPASLHITSTQEQTTPHRPLSMTISEGGSSTKPVAATQPVQAVTRNRENGGRTPTFSRDAKDDAPSSWRTGLRKTGSFDDKSKASVTNTRSEIERSSSYSSKFSDDSKSENTRLARVAPILDVRKSKSETETDDYETSGYQRSTSFSRREKKAADSVPTIITTDTDTSTTFKRSSVSETPSDTTAPSNDVVGAAKADDPERRRSHLQPVRDEEAEAQRRIRSRRERQTRRSTQGVTLDVYEEAMRTIGQMKQKPAEKAGTDASTDSTKTRNDSASSLKRSDDSQQTPSSSAQSSLYSSSSASTGTPVTSLPSGYIPSDQRVKANESSDSKTPGLHVPSITVDTSPVEDETDKGDASISTENGNSAVQNRKSAALQRRRNRKERRSTGLPDLRPSSSATENAHDQDEDEISPKDDATDSVKAERLRAKYDSSSLPSRHERHRPGVRSSDSDIPSKFSAGDETSSYSRGSRTTDQNYRKLYEDNQAETDRLRTELVEAQRKISELQARLEKAEENTTRKQALENEKRERRALERKLSEMEKEIQDGESAESLRIANGSLKAENNALHRIVEKLGGSVPDIVSRVIEETPKEELKDSTVTSNQKSSKVKSESAPDLTKLEKDADKEVDSKSDSPRTPVISRSSSSSSLSLEEDSTDVRRTSVASQPSSESSLRVPYYRREGTDSASSGYSGSSYSSLRNKARLESSTSSPSLLSRSVSPRRALPSQYSGTSDYIRGSSSVTDYGRTSSFTPSRYTSSRRDATSGLSSGSGYNTIPGSSSRRDYLRSLPPSSSGSSSLRSGTGSSYRSTPSPYGSSSSSSYSSPSRPRHGYSSSTGRSGTSSKLTSLSKYPTGMSSLSSTRRTMKY